MESLHVVLPFMAMIKVDFLSISLELKGLTRTATFTDPDMAGGVRWTALSLLSDTDSSYPDLLGGSFSFCGRL